MDGRPYGKLLPRYAGPIAGFLFAQPQASRADLIDFIDRTFGVRVSRVALYKFLKKFGLDEAARQAAAGAAAPPLPAPVTVPDQPAPTPAPPLCSGTRSTPAPSC